VKAEGRRQKTERRSKPAIPALIWSRHRRDTVRVPFLHSSFFLLPFRRNSSPFAPRRVMLPFWGSIQLRDDEIIL
jgi:hypothetical protein